MQEGKKPRGESWIPADAAAARSKLNELIATDELSGRCLAMSWEIAIEVVRISMPLVGEKETWPNPIVLPATTLPDDLDDPEIVRRLVGTNISLDEQRVYGDFITRLFALLRERRVPDAMPRITFFSASVALYLYELCRLALGADDLKPEIWALSELVYNVAPRFPQSTDEWSQQRDTWRKRKKGDKDIPIAKLRHDVEAALSELKR